MPLSSVFKQTEDLLEEVLRAIREEYENPFPVLCETDRDKFVEEERDLRKQLKETVESESTNCQWRNWVGLPSQQTKKCLRDAKELRQRVREDINEKLRTRLSGKSNPPSSASHGQGPAFDPMGARPASTVVTSPLNMRCSLTDVSEAIVYPRVRNDDGHTFGLNEAINTPLETSSDRSSESSSRPRRRSPPPPPSPQRMIRSSNSHVLSETASDSSSGSPRRSPSVRRPAPPPPQSPRRSGTPGSPPVNGSFHLPGTLSPNSVMMSHSISELTQQVDKLVSSIVKESLSIQAQDRRGLRRSQDYVTKTNCVDIIGSNADGVTLNNGGSNNTGAVIHKMLPPPSPRRV